MLVATGSHPLAECTSHDIGPAVERLWTAAVDGAARHEGYPSSLTSGQVCVVFGRADAAVRTALLLSQRVAEVRIGLATGEVRRFVNPLTRRFEYFGPPVVRAERRCRHLQMATLPVASKAVLADQASERVAAA